MARDQDARDEIRALRGVAEGLDAEVTGLRRASAQFNTRFDLLCEKLGYRVDYRLDAYAPGPMIVKLEKCESCGETHEERMES